MILPPDPTPPKQQKTKSFAKGHGTAKYSWDLFLSSFVFKRPKRGRTGDSKTYFGTGLHAISARIF